MPRKRNKIDGCLYLRNKNPGCIYTVALEQIERELIVYYQIGLGTF